MKKRVLSIAIFMCFWIAGSAQSINKNELAARISPMMSRMGSMEGSGIRDIIDSFRNQRYTEVEMVYAIYYWITHYVAFDSRAFHRPRQANFTASFALSSRQTASEGYANLFKAMCDVARIECVVIDGLAKAHPEWIGKISDHNRHTWNAVKIGNTWYYADAMWGAGITDHHLKNFQKNYTDAWIFTKRQLFVLSHFPKDKKWQIVDEPINKAVFSGAPSIHSGAVVLQVYPEAGLKGRIRGRQEDCKRIVLKADVPEMVNSADVLVENRRYPAQFYLQGQVLSIDLPLPEDGKYPLMLYLNGAPTFGFLAEVTPKKR